MAIQYRSDQQLYTGKGPLDAKALVKTYSDLLSVTYWTKDDLFVAYNGMVVAVYLDKIDNALSDKNGIYYLFDPQATTAIKKPDVTNEANWHKLGDIDTLPELADQITAIQAELENLQSDVDALQDTAPEVVDLKSQLPAQGHTGKLYVVVEEAMTYVWHNNSYLPVGDGDSDAENIQIIMGGGPAA